MCTPFNILFALVLVATLAAFIRDQQTKKDSSAPPKDRLPGASDDNAQRARNAALDEAVSACKIQFLDFPISDEDTAYNEGVEACISIIEALKTPQP